MPARKEAKELFQEYAVLRRSLDLETDPTARISLTRKCAQKKGKIAEGYLRYVIKSARGRTRDRDSLLADLISAGNEGVLIAIDKYSLDYGTQFLTYAAYWVDVKMDDVLHSMDTVHLAPHARKKHVQKGEQPPSMKTTPIDDVQVAATDNVYEETLPHGAYSMRCLHQAGLSPLERVVVRFSLGLRGQPLDEDQVSLVLLGMDGSVVTRSEVRKIRNAGIAKLRKWAATQSRDELLTQLAE